MNNFENDFSESSTVSNIENNIYVGKRCELNERNILVVILLVWVTCGIYGFVLFFIFGEELRRETMNKNVGFELMSPIGAFFLSIITCGIYGLYYVYKQAEALQKIGARRNVSTVEPIVVLLLAIFFGIGLYFNVYSGSEIKKTYNMH